MIALQKTHGPPVLRVPPYQALADIYDELLAANAFVSRFLQTASEFGLPNRNVLDLGCGTGAFAITVARRNYNVEALDTSSAMLRIARARGTGRIRWRLADARVAGLGESLGCIICNRDVFNYFPGEALLKILHRCRSSLEANGLLMFDVVTPYALKAVHGKFERRVGGMTVIFNNRYCAATYKLTAEIDIRKDGSAAHFRELHVQRGYSLQQVSHLIAAAGLKRLKIADVDGERPCPPSEKTKRLFIVCRRAAP